MTLRRTLKSIYMRLPFTRALFTALRAVWVPPHSIYRYLYFRGVFPIRVDDEARFLVHHHGFQVETDIFWCGLTGGWEGQSLAYWTRLCRRSSVILDVGANTGIYALVAKAVNPRARVHAFEPIARVHEKLVQNNALNHFDIGCHAVAVSDFDGEAVLYDLDAENIYTVTVNSNMHDAGLPVIETRVPTVRLDTFIAREQLPAVDLIKLDVESHEPQVLAGLGDYLERFRPTLLVEVWHNEEHGDLRVGPRVEASVAGRGYLFFRIDEITGPVREEHIAPPGKGYSNYLICTPQVAGELGLA